MNTHSHCCCSTFLNEVPHEQHTYLFFTKFLRLLGSFLALCLLLTKPLNAQEVLVGLSSNGGLQAKGTAYSIKTDGSSFNVMESFADWGAHPVSSLVKGNDGNLYGMAPKGGVFNHGTIFRVTPLGEITILKSFRSDVDGGEPTGSLFLGKDGNFYGTASTGGANYSGTLFKITPDGHYTILRHLNMNADGGRPYGRLIQATDGSFYGTNSSGGAGGYGNVFKLTESGQYSVLKSFNNTDGASPHGGLLQAADGDLYGMTRSGGTTKEGVIFRLTTTGTYTVLRHLAYADGILPTGDLIQGKDGFLYGMAPSGGNYNGTIFKMNTAGTFFNVLRNMTPEAEGFDPTGSLIQAADGNFYGMAYGTAGGYYGSVFKMTPGGVVSPIKKFTLATEGGHPKGSLVQMPDGALYGMTNSGGKSGQGTIVKVTNTGATTVLVHLNGALKGNAPQGDLVIAKDSSYFGVSRTGGQYKAGSIFRICGDLTTVVRSFNLNADGGNPAAGLLRASDGNFYGMTPVGGLNGGGTIYRISPSGNFSVLRHLTSATDGAEPRGTLVQGSDDALYGITHSGGSSFGGTIFRITTAGSFSVLRNLAAATDGNASEGGLVLGTDGALYGMTGTNTRFFKITTGGEFTILKTLAYSADGNNPAGNMIRGADGAFYGVLSSGGTYGKGVIFRITTTGGLTKLRHLNGTTDGGTPKGGLIQGKDGALYGTTSMGGTHGAGTIFRITTSSNYAVLRHLNMTTDGGAPLGGLIIAPVNNLVAHAQPNVTTAEDISKAIVLSGSGHTTLTYSVVKQPRNGSIASGSGINRTYVPKANFNGKDSFAFTVNVGCFSSAPAWVVINVTPVNDAPVLAAVGNKTGSQSAPLSFTATASDVDNGQALSFSLLTAPAGAQINAASGLFTWTPSATGSFTFKVRVTDNGEPVLFDEETITVTVSPGGQSGGSKGVKVNLFGGTNPFLNAEWNNWNVSGSLNSGALKYSDGTSSTAVAAITKHILSDNGASYGGTMAPPEVLRYTSYASSARTLTLSGLSTTKTYNLEFYASRANTGNSTTFTINAAAITVLTDNNKTNKVFFSSITPNAGGQIVVNIANVNTYNYLNGFILTENASGGNQSPTVSAGGDKAITLPANSVVLNGSATDPDGSIASYAWTKLSGPASFTFSNAAAPAPTVSNLTEGSYVFRLTATDNGGATAFDDVQVVVSPAAGSAKYVKLNLYGGTNPYTNPEWNNWNVTASLNSGTLGYSDNTSSTITAALSKSSGINDNGASYGGTMSAPEVLRYATNSNTARTLTFSGLSTTKTYSLELYASRANTGNSTTFTINGTAVAILTDHNKTNKAVFSGLAATAGGQLIVSIANVNSYNYLNGLILTESGTPPPPPPPTGPRHVKVNVFGGSNAYNNAEWNNWNVSASLNSGALKYSDATTSPISAALSRSSGINDNGTTYGSGMAPAEVLRYSSNATTSRTLTFSGLSTGKTYALELYASRGNYNGNFTNFTIGGVLQSISTFNNLTSKASFTGLTADGAGQIVVSITNPQTYNYLNGFTLTENSSGTVPLTTTRMGPATVEGFAIETRKGSFELEASPLQVKASPNPSSSFFTIRIRSKSQVPVDLRLVDAIGRVVEQKQNIASTSTLTMGRNLKPGTYYLQGSQGKDGQRIKLVKTAE